MGVARLGLFLTMFLGVFIQMKQKGPGATRMTSINSPVPTLVFINALEITTVFRILQIASFIMHVSEMVFLDYYLVKNLKYLILKVDFVITTRTCKDVKDIIHQKKSWI